MALAANNFIMAKSNLLALFILVVLSFPSLSYGLTKNFVNTSMPDMRPTFVVNFDMATVICQHSENPEDLHLHEISILCNGKNDCFNNPAMDDESFPYCEGKCNSTCNDRGACLYDGEKAQCYCNSGYHGPSCEITDKNECEDKPCHWLAKCTNTINSTKCDCFAGFKGDGFECTDIDECQSNVANCPEYSQCVNLPGTYFCNCTTGFMPKSALMPTCVDINECELDMHNCADNELCQNTFGSFECVKECSKGYQINGTFCEDVDECLELHQCDKRATCENTNGGYKCICDDGFTGDGHSCSPITDCSKNENICHRHGFCIASLKMCICETGYAGDGLSCHDINECEHPTENPCKDQSDNKCVNIEGGYICCDSKLNDQECIEEKGAYCSGGCGLHAICFNQTCTCVDGFEGDPKVKCNDLNECEDESICPGVGQWCVNMIGGHICCGRDSTHPECKGLEINAFEGNFGKGSISNAQLTEARSRGFFTHIIEKGERQENSSGGVVVVVRGNESDSSGEAIASNGITFTFEVPTCNDNQNTTICPSNSECKQGRCTCTDGFEWSRTSGSCIDVDECEKLSQPCLIGADVWCVNLIGSYQCCNSSSSESECLGLEISAVDVSTGEGGLHTSGSGENDSKATSRKPNQWKIETFGEWRNVSGGRAIIIEGKLASNVTEASTLSSTTINDLSSTVFATNPGKEMTTKSTELSTSSTLKYEQSTVSIDLTDISTTSSTITRSIINDTSEETTTPLTPRAAPEIKETVNPITKILQNLGIITTKKVTSKPVLLVTAGPNSIEALDLAAEENVSSTPAYSESTFLTNTATPKITSTESTSATRTTRKKQGSKGKVSKKPKTTKKVSQTSTSQPSTAISTKEETTVTTSMKDLFSSTTTTKPLETTLRIINDTELARSTASVNNDEENTSTMDSSKLTSHVPKSTFAATTEASSTTLKMTTKKAKKPNKSFKPTKGGAKNIKKGHTTTLKLPTMSTTVPFTFEPRSTTAPDENFSTKTTIKDESFEMEVMVTMRSTTEKNTRMPSTSVTPKSTTLSTFSSYSPAKADKGIKTLNSALSTTTPPHMTTEFDIFIPDTPPITTTKAQPRILLNMTFFSHNFTTVPPPISPTTSFQTDAPFSTPSIKNMFPLPPDINIEMINPEKVTPQIPPFSTPSITVAEEGVSEEMSFTSTTGASKAITESTSRNPDISNFFTFSTVEENNFTTLPYPKIQIQNKSAKESSTTLSLLTSIDENSSSITNFHTFIGTSNVPVSIALTSDYSTEITSPTSQPIIMTSPTTNFLGSTTDSNHQVSTENLTNNNKILTSTNLPMFTDKTFSSASYTSTTKRKGMELIFVDETTLPTTSSTADLTAIPTDSVSTEILTSGEKGLEISAPFKQGSSTEIPDSGEMGLEISGKSTIGGSEQPGKTTNIVETSTKINLPQTEIENPEDGEHLTQEEIERLKKLKANETSTTTIILTTINPTSTPSSVQTTTEDLSIVKSGEMGLELSGASTLSSAEEFTSEPATAHSSTPESSPTTQTLDSTSVSESTVSATTAETASEKPTKEEEATSTVAASSTPSDETSPAKASPKSHEGSFEKVPKSGEVGLEIGGSDLSGTTQTTTPQSSTTENELTTSIGDSSLLTTVKSPTDTSEETSTEPSSTSSKATEESTVGSELSSTVSVPSELTTTPTSTAGETNTTESEQPSNSITSASPEKSTSSPTEITKEIASSTLATTSGAEEITTIVSSTPALSTPSVEITVETTLSTPSEASSISFESTTIGGNLTETTTLSATEVTDKISEATLNTTPSLTPTTSDEMGLELTGKEFTKTTEAESSSSTVTITKAEATTELSLTTITASSTANETVQTTTVAEPKQSSTAIISNSSPASTLISESTTILSVTGQTSGTTETSEAVTIDNDRSSTTPSAATGTTPSGESLSSTQTTTPEDKTTGSISTSATEQISTFEASTISSPAATETSVPKSTELTTPENTESTFVPDKIITTGSVTGSLTSEIPTTVSSTPETPVTSVAPTTETPTTKISSTETSSSTAGGSTIQEQTIETSATTEGDLSTSSSTPEPTSSPTEQVQSSTVDITPSTESSISSSEPSPTSVESEAITPTFEQTYATFEASTVSSSTEASVTDTLPTSETLSPAVTETIVATTESSATEKEQTSTALPAETTFGITASESPIDFTTIKSLEITTEQLPPVVIVDKSRSHEEVDENSQQRITSTANPVTDSTEAETSPLSKTKCLSNDECENDSYCERRSGVCSCKPGFDGEPPQQSCQDIDECKQNLDDCHSSSRCLNYNGGYHCVCAIGYRKNANGVCEDIDECIASNGTICDSHAICRNLPGAYLCECNAGYTGDGYNCISIEKRHCNQNEWAKSDCGRNHFCLVDGNGKIDCDVCKNGFIMKNGICSDINECDENQKLCHTDAICQNIMGGYQCRCQPGYAGDGHNCQDIDECGIQNSCHPQATCVNAPGSFMCECPEGWTGDGKNACLNPADQKCSQRSQVCLNGRSNSACLSLKVGESFESACECLPNYRYNSTTLSCEDIDECAENRDNCDTANTVCVNTIGGFQCHCAAGYEGSGGICSDIDECKRGLAGCHVNAHCINRIGGVECRCGAGYTGDGTDCFPLDNRQVGGSDCSDDWVNMCRSRNKTCHIDDEEVPQCGSCMFGYQPMDGKCQPINALGNCADPSKNDCDANAECIDVRPGRHFCSCKIGFIGDGMHCDDVDECSIPRLCDFHAVCKNTNGSYECQCKEGFIGNGFKCVPANQSQNCRISPEICHTHAGCQPDGTCKCLRGYEGDGVTDCKRTSVTDGYDEGETSTSRRPYFTTEAFFTSTTTDRHCSARDRTACHVLATCDLDLGECVCRQGFMGDGYIACTRIWEDCTTDKTMCHTNATCDSETKQCQCNLGFIGDGVSCVPDKMDCIIRPNLCSEMAECVARRCVCGPGFTGDGSICMPVEPPQFIAGNCSLCHIQAICANGGCRCGQGCFGNGALCVPDPEDCLNYPGVCHMNGICDATSRRCSCKKGFSGNGLDCSKRISCHTDPSICHKDATCLSDGRCECNHGLIGDGVECLKPLTAAEIFGTSAPQLIHFECPSSCGSNAECINGACKCLTGYIADENSVCTDIDECKMLTAQCHPHAECINQEGTYECRCLAGYSGSGKECSTAVLDNPDGLKVECKDDGLDVVLVEETSSFNGRIFVRGQSENPYCTKTFNGSEALPLAFHVPIAHCDMQLEENDTLAVTVIIQKHPLFVTEQAYAYRLKCTYPTATRNIMSHYNVSEITTVETINTKGVEPACQLTVTNERNVTIDSAIVGQVLKLALFVLPNDSFTVLPRNCYAINLETSQRYTLTDEAGCAIDAQLFPEWTRINPSLTHATFRTFKWPDSSMIRFECDCSACVADCPVINCERRREEQKAKLRFARDEGAVGTSENQDALWLKNSPSNIKPATSAFSAVVVVMDDAEEQLAQKQVEEWLYKGSLHESEFFSNLDEDRICVSAPWAILCLFSIIISISLLLTMTQIYKRRISKKKAELQHRATNFYDNNSAYIKF